MPNPTADDPLAKHLGKLVDELQRRMEAERGSGRELKAAVRQCQRIP